MLYNKKNHPFSMEEFKNPGSEYRGAPFWAWNCRLDRDTILQQIAIFQEMGFGGFHAHVRTGLDTAYLGDEYLEYIRLCADRAKESSMLLWLYDEDRWPSGAAGGYVTRDRAFRERFLRLSPFPKRHFAENMEQFHDSQTGEDGQEPFSGCLLARYHVKLNNGCLDHYVRLADNETEGENTDGTPVWYAYLELSEESPWFNNESYVNTLDKKAIDRFLQVTHDTYAKTLGDEFSRTIPAIFTDEPQFKTKETFDFAEEQKEIILPFTDDLPETFAACYGYDLLDKLPEIFWNLPDRYSQVRYHYHDHICNRFVEAFPRNIGAWCDSHGLALTGHVNAEQTLTSQTYSVGAAMRCYPYFQLPGIDMLCDNHEYATAKQAQSIVHQYGREGMLSELYGVTNWDFDFKGHKLQGDWQAALGVTIRVPHLSWMSMAGEAKRDYPASIFHQSPWYQEYPFIEDHFARLNTALTRGCCHVRVGVIHPIESFWLLWGPRQQSHDQRRQAEEDFDTLIRSLLFGLIDFDFIDEALLPELARGGNPLKVGEMNYDCILLPPMLTIRSTTVDILTGFLAEGGKVISLGQAPSMENAVRSDVGKKLWEKATPCPLDRFHLLELLEPVRDLDILSEQGVRTDHLLYQMRQDGAERWLFICHVYRKDNGLEHPERIHIRIRGLFRPVIYDTVTGSVSEISFRQESGFTVIETSFYSEDSLLLRLLPCSDALCGNASLPGISEATQECEVLQEHELTQECDLLKEHEPFQECELLKEHELLQECALLREYELPSPCGFTLSEPNSLLLDMAEYSLDGEAFQPREELLRVDNCIRSRLGYPRRMDHVAQPWVIREDTLTRNVLCLRFTIQSSVSFEGALLALEPQSGQKITFNGETVPLEYIGSFTDSCIRTVALPPVRPGENELLLTMDYTEKTNVEWCYLLGSFGVNVQGEKITLLPYPDNLSYGSVTTQGLAFYGANITYHIALESDGIHAMELSLPHFSGSLVRVYVDDWDAGTIVFSPHRLNLGVLPAGRHECRLLLYGNRYNSFGCLHNTNTDLTWFGPTCFRTEGNDWSYQYQLKPFGILQNPHIRLYKTESERMETI